MFGLRLLNFQLQRWIASPAYFKQQPHWMYSNKSISLCMNPRRIWGSDLNSDLLDVSSPNLLASLLPSLHSERARPQVATLTAAHICKAWCGERLAGSHPGSRKLIQVWGIPYASPFAPVSLLPSKARYDQVISSCNL